METTIKLINEYLNKTLSQNEANDFEDRLNSDKDFQKKFTEHLIFLEGIKRSRLKIEISEAQSHFNRRKWLNIGSVISILLIAIWITLNFIITANSSEDIPRDLNNNNNNKPARIERNTLITDTVKYDITPDEVIIESQSIVTLNDSSRNVKIETLKTALKKAEKPIIDKDAVITDIESFYKKIKKEQEFFNVNSNEDVIIKGKEGTVITVPAYSFMDQKTSLPVEGIVNFEITEYYKLSDILLANLSTKSDEHILETGGMLYLKATQNGRELSLLRGKNIKIAFNTDKKEMSLFNGEINEGMINWELANQEIIEIVSNDNETVSFSTVQSSPIYPGCEELNNEERRRCFNEQIKRLYARKFDRSLMRLYNSSKLSIAFDIDNQGTIINIKVRANSQELINEAIRVTKLIPKMIPARQDGIAVSVNYIIPLSLKVSDKSTKASTVKVSAPNNMISSKSIFQLDSINSKETVILGNFQNQSGRNKKQLDELNKTLLQNKDTVSGFIKNINRDVLERYAFSNSQLGWINCDRFTRSKKKKVKMKFKVKNADGSSIKMVFKSMNSVLPSTFSNEVYNFGYVPSDELVILVAIKKNGDRFFLATKEIQTKSLTNLKLDFKEVSLREIKIELKDLDKLFQ